MLAVGASSLKQILETSTSSRRAACDSTTISSLGDEPLPDGVEALVRLKVSSCARWFPFLKICGGCCGVEGVVDDPLESREPEGERMLPLSDVTVPERHRYNERVQRSFHFRQ